MEATIFIGKISKSHGVKGEVMLVFEDDSIQLKKKTNYLLLAKKNSTPVPYFIETLFSRPNGLLIKFENINSPDEARSIVHTDVFAEEKFIEQEVDDNESENYGDGKFTGFEIHDKNFGVVGKIKMSLAFPGQIVFSVEHSSGAEVLLPANQKMIIEIKEKEKIIFYEAPEGLIEMYIESKKK